MRNIGIVVFVVILSLSLGSCFSSEIPRQSSLEGNATTAFALNSSSDIINGYVSLELEIPIQSLEFCGVYYRRLWNQRLESSVGKNGGQRAGV